MARFSSSSSRSSLSSRYYGAKATYNASSGKRSPSACDEVAVRYPNGVKTVIHHSNFRASAIARNNSNDFCKSLLQLAVEVSLFCGPDREFSVYQRHLLEDCGIEVDVGSSKNGSSEND
ncbi:hypothetical protein DVH24_027334 [Malus domestica]|uniref:Uncharacterized protein n=1 Tax=Malus domestica TaxID=3750 RepID=A0A498IQL3_MALDO|nr:hypothetical protein DVH24_027334 [Malus domestica]